MSATISNKEIAAQFELLVQLLELAGVNPFKIKSYSIAAFRINKLQSPLMEMSDAEIRQIENIGPAVIAKIDEIKQTGTIAELEKLLAQTPAGIIEMLQIKGLGAKKARQLWLELEIESIGELAYACQENRLITLKGFGKKTQENIYNNIQFILANKDQLLYAEVEVISQQILLALEENYEGDIQLVGEIARNMNTIQSIEYVTNIEKKCIDDFFDNHYGQTLEHVDDITYSIQLDKLPLIKFLIVESSEIPALVLQLNSSPSFFEYLQENYAMENIQSEQEFFSKNKLNYLPAPLREIQYTSLLTVNNLSTAIQTSDIKGLIHCHSTYSDGLHTLDAMAQACIDRGLEYMVITDHSISAFYANGLTHERILEQHKEIDALNRKLAPFKIFKGIEADIRHSGDIDYEEATWKLFDVIIASVHSNLRMTAEQANHRILKALENPYVTMLGHPTGRLLLSRAGYPVDMEQIINKCAEKNIAIEINAHPRRLDMDWSWVKTALEHGVSLSINPDAHSIDGIDLMKYGVITAQKTTLTPAQNISSMTLEEFESWLASRRQH